MHVDEQASPFSPHRCFFLEHPRGFEGVAEADPDGRGAPGEDAEDDWLGLEGGGGRQHLLSGSWKTALT